MCRATAFRKIKYSFRKNSGVTDPAALTQLYATADTELASMHRQVLTPLRPASSHRIARLRWFSCVATSVIAVALWHTRTTSPPGTTTAHSWRLRVPPPHVPPSFCESNPSTDLVCITTGIFQVAVANLYHA